MGIAIREGTSTDAAACGVIASAALVGCGLAVRLPHAARIFADASPFTLTTGRRLIVECGGNPVAFADIRPDSGRLAFLFVTPRRQREGVGSLLLSAAETALGREAWLSVLSVNEDSLHFYLRRAYQIVGKRQQRSWHGGRVTWIHLHKTTPGNCLNG